MRICKQIGENYMNKKELKQFLQEDKKALGVIKKRPSLFTDFEWRLEIILRKAEYYNQFKFHPLRYYYLVKYRKMELKYMTFIPLYTCGKGLSIAHVYKGMNVIYFNSIFLYFTK